MPMSHDGRADAVLELSILLFSGDGNPRPSSSAFFLPSKPKPFAVAWIDPAVKRSTKILLSRDSSPKIHLPLSSRALHDPAATLNIQILSSRFPFRRGGGGGARLEGAAALPLNSIPAMAGNTLTLPLVRPSGRPGGYVRIIVRVLCCLGATPPASSSVECSDWASEVDTWPHAEVERIELCKLRSNAVRITEDEGREPPTLPHADPLDSSYWPQKMEFFRVESNAPWFPNDNPPNLRLPHASFADCGDPVLQMEFCRVEPNAPPLPEENARNILPFPRLQVLPVMELSDRVPAVATGVPVDARHIEFPRMEPNVSTHNGKEGRAWRSFWVGLASGLLAVVMVGAAGLSEG